MKIFEKLLKFSWLIWAVVLLITAGSLYEIKTNTRLETNLDKYMPESNPAFVYSNKAEALFGIKDGIIIAIENPKGIYNPGTLKKIKDLTKEVEKMKEIKKEDVTSLYTADNIVGSEMGLEVKAFYTRVPHSKAALEKLRKEVETNDMVYGRIVSKDGKVAAVVAEIGSNVFNQAFYKRILHLADKYAGPEKIYVAGRPIVEGTLAQQMPQDMKVMGPLVILVIAIALMIMLRSVKAMVLNLIVVLLSTIWVFGLMALFKIPVYSVTTMIPVMLIAIGVAYGIHLFSHLHMYMVEHPDAGKKEAIVNMIKYMWKPVLMAAITTAVGFLSLLTSEVYPVKYFGIFTAFGVMAAFLFALVLIPASLMLVGLPKMKKKDPKKEKQLEKKLEKKKDRRTIAYKFTDWVLGHKKTVAAIFVAILGLSIFGITRVYVDSSFLANFNKNSSIRVTDKYINEHFAGTSSFNVILESGKKDTFKTPAALKLTDELQAELEKIPVVGGTFSLTDFIDRMNMVMNADDPKYNTIPDSKNLIAQYLLLYEMSGDPATLDAVVDYGYKTLNLTVQLHSDDSKTLKKVIAVVDKYKPRYKDLGIEVKYAGSGYKSLVFTELLLEGQISSLAVSIIIVIVLLTLMFKNFKIGLIGSIPILIASLMNFGAMGLFNIALGPTTALISSIAVGIGIDYAIHFIENYREFSLKVPDKLETSRLTMSNSGRAILFNAIVVISGFLVFLFSMFPPNRQLGILVSLNMFASFAGTLSLMFLLVYITNIYFKKGDKK